MENCNVCGQERDEHYMLFRNNLYFCNAQCYASFYTAVNTKGANVEFQASETHLQWKYVNDTVWIDLIPLTELEGEPGAPGTTDYDELTNKPDLTTKVDKVTGSSLVADTEISKIHASGSDNQDLSGKADVGHLHTGTYEPSNSNIQTHVGSAHAPSNAVPLSTVKALFLFHK